jgi:SAM-dependent methyltransferase
MPQLPPLSQHDCAYFDYVEGLKVYNYTRHVKTLLRDYEEKAARFEEEKGYLPSTMEEAATLIEPDPLYQLACGIQRTSQVLMWTAGIDSVKPHREQLLARLDGSAQKETLGRLELNPALKLPPWYVENDIHLVPGGYWGDELVGAVYQRALAVYSTNWRSGRNPGFLQAFAASAPKRDYRRILDVGCAMGNTTFALRRVYPEAEEVIGIDLSAAALKWAHASGEEQGLAITFSQRYSGDTGYPDESFDLIAGHFILHEQPPDSVDATVREIFRLLRPGGHMMFLEPPPYRAVPPQVAFLEDFDTRGNGEPFWGPFLSRDFPAVLRAAGFENVGEGPLEYQEPGYWGSAALMRTGEFQPYNRWVTRGDKPPVDRAAEE